MARHTTISHSPSPEYHDASTNHDAPLSIYPDITEREIPEALYNQLRASGVSRQGINRLDELLDSTCVIPSEISLAPRGQCLLGHKWRLDSIKSIPIAFFAVFFITLTFEYLRVMAKRLDNYIIARALRHSLDQPPPAPKKVCSNPDCPFQQGQSPQPDDEKIRRGTGLLKCPDVESGRKGYYVTETRLQLARAFLYMLITMLGYILVLFVVMTLNLVVIWAILLGAAVGKFLTDWLKFDIMLSKSEAAPTPVAAVGEGVQSRGDREATAGRYA